MIGVILLVLGVSVLVAAAFATACCIRLYRLVCREEGWDR